MHLARSNELEEAPIEVTVHRCTGQREVQRHRQRLVHVLRFLGGHGNVAVLLQQLLLFLFARAAAIFEAQSLR